MRHSIKSLKELEEPGKLIIKQRTPANKLLPSWIEGGCSLLGIFIGMGIICFISTHYNMHFLIPSFASSAIMIFMSPENPLAQPRNVLGGHVMAALAGIITNYLFSNTWWAITLAVVLAALLMIVTRTLHPPGGATAIVAHLGGCGSSSAFILIPVVANSIIMVLTALIINHFLASKYPRFR